MELKANNIQSDEVMDSDPTMDIIKSAPSSPTHFDNKTEAADPGVCRATKSLVIEAY
jgi:hypothetical protein